VMAAMPAPAAAQWRGINPWRMSGMRGIIAQARPAGTATGGADRPARPAPPVSSVDLDPAPELLVLVADELDRLLVGQQPLIHPDRPRLRVRFRILEREIDLQVPVGRPAEPLGELRLAAVRAAVHVEPAVVRAVLRAAQVVRLDDERVALPVADRIAVPPRLRLALRRELAP